MQTKEEGYTKSDINQIDLKKGQTGGTLISFYGKITNGMSDKQKNLVLIATGVSIFAGIGLFAYFKAKKNGIKISIGGKSKT